MAQDGLFFKALGNIHPIHLTPAACLVAQAAWSILLTFTGSYEQLGTYVIFAVFVFPRGDGRCDFRVAPDAARLAASLPHVGLSVDTGDFHPRVARVRHQHLVERPGSPCGDWVWSCSECRPTRGGATQSKRGERTANG